MVERTHGGGGHAMAALLSVWDGQHSPAARGWRVEYATADDIPAILRIVHAAYARNVADGYPMAAASESASDVWRDMQTMTVLVVRPPDSDRAVASIRLSFPTDEAHVYVTRLAVLPDWQSRGIAGLLLDVTEHLAVQQGRQAIQLDTARDYSRLSAFYHRRGFAPLHERQWPGRPYISQVWERTIAPNAAPVLA